MPQTSASHTERPSRLRLFHLFYVTALVASAINLMGPFGLIIASIICAGWGYIFFVNRQSSRRQRVVSVVIVSILMSLLFMCLLPAIQSAGLPRSAARRMGCSNNVKMICLALHNYHSAYGSFPPAVTYDATGKALHSWRVLLLPFLEEEKLYDAYSMDEAWDGPNNRKLLSRMPQVFACPFRDRSDFTTSYCVVVDEHSCFPPRGSRKLADVLDATLSTVAVVEYSPGVAWMAPFDPSLKEFKRDVVTWGPNNLPPHYHANLLTEYFTGSNIGFVDGHVSHFGVLRDEGIWDKSIGIDDGGPSVEELDAFNNRVVSSRPRPAGYFALAAFIFLTALPTFWLFPHEPEKRHGASD